MPPATIQSEIISRRECRAIRILDRDGWTVGELALTFQVDQGQIRAHRDGHCSHGCQAPEQTDVGAHQ